jgi:prevent-host-death family protein
MQTVSIREARKRLSELVSAAERGEAVTISRRGRKVAQLVPAEQGLPQGLPDLTDFRASLRVKGPGLSEEVIAMRGEERH